MSKAVISLESMYCLCLGTGNSNIKIQGIHNLINLLAVSLLPPPCLPATSPFLSPVSFPRAIPAISPISLCCCAGLLCPTPVILVLQPVTAWVICLHLAATCCTLPASCPPDLLANSRSLPASCLCDLHMCDLLATQQPV